VMPLNTWLAQSKKRRGTKSSGSSQEEERQQQQDRAAADAESARQLCLAQVRGFSCSQRSRVVQLGLTQQLLHYVQEQQLDDDVKAALLGPLHLV